MILMFLFMSVITTVLCMMCKCDAGVITAFGTIIFGFFYLIEREERH